VLLIACAGILYPGFLKPLVFANILRNNAYLGILAVGMTFVILSGGIDLSVGTLLALSTILLARAVDAGLHPLLATLAVVAAGTAFGAAQGSLIHCFRLPPFLVTLAGMFLAKGLAFTVSLQSLTISHPHFQAAASFRVLAPGRAPLTTAAWLFLAVLATGILISRQTRFGRNVYAIGGNEHTALLMGLPISSTKIGVYALSGCCAALAGLAMSLNTRSGNPAIGLGMELDAIACAVIGGVLLTGGSGSVFGAFLGVLIFGTIKTALDFHGGLDSSWLRIAMGILLLVFIVLQRGLSAAGKLRAAAH
jgi:simple sugar transport system permease protein